MLSLRASTAASLTSAATSAPEKPSHLSLLFEQTLFVRCVWWEEGRKGGREARHADGDKGGDCEEEVVSLQSLFTRPAHNRTASLARTHTPRAHSTQSPISFPSSQPSSASPDQLLSLLHHASRHGCAAPCGCKDTGTAIWRRQRHKQHLQGTAEGIVYKNKAFMFMCVCGKHYKPRWCSRNTECVAVLTQVKASALAHPTLANTPCPACQAAAAQDQSCLAGWWQQPHTHPAATHMVGRQRQRAAGH